jgi:hypothetical protein
MFSLYININLTGTSSVDNELDRDYDFNIEFYLDHACEIDYMTSNMTSLPWPDFDHDLKGRW